jgi:hypothetical protein
VARWELIGGFLPPEWLALRAPRLVVYADGQAIADARYAQRLDRAALTDLLAHLDADLSDPAVTRTQGGGVAIMDAPSTRLSVRTDKGERTVTVEALDEYPQGTFSAALYDARQRLGGVYDAVVRAGVRYLGDRVRVVAVAAGSDSVTAKAWPIQVQAPTMSGGGPAVLTLTGQEARDAARLLTEGSANAPWPVYRLRAGSVVQASWRSLLPDE